MSNPLSRIGQTPQPEASAQVQQRSDQARSQQQGSDAGQSQSQGGRPAETQPPASSPSEPPATRLPQHPLQQQDDPVRRPGHPQRIRQQGETHAEDTSLPAPTDAD
jgi:hypothetical protein